MDACEQEQLPPGTALLLVIGEPFSEEQKILILGEITKGFRCWDVEGTGIDINENLAQIANRASLGEERANANKKPGERLILHQSDNLAVEILINPLAQTVKNSLKKLLIAPARTKYMIYAGQIFQGSGAWVLQDDTFTFSSLLQVLKNIDVENTLKQSTEANLTIHTPTGGNWETSISKADFTNNLKIHLNPPEKLDNIHGVLQFTAYVGGFISVVPITSLLQASEQFGNISFTRPTLYIFPGCQGDSALFGVSGFNLLVNGGYNKRACFWDFARHLDRIDAMLVTHLGTDNIFGLKTVFERKSLEDIHPQIGYLYMNAPEKPLMLPSGEEGVKEASKNASLLINLSEEANKLTQMAKQLGVNPHSCSRSATAASCEPINLYHKLGHGSLDMYILNPVSDSKELKEFFQMWSKQASNLGTNGSFSLQNSLSVCALLVWKPYSLDEKIVRIFFPGNAPQHKIIEGFEKMKSFDFLKHASCTTRDLMKPAPVRKPVGGSKPTTGGKAAPLKVTAAAKSETGKSLNSTGPESPRKEIKTVPAKTDTKPLSPTKPVKPLRDESSKNLKIKEKSKSDKEIKPKASPKMMSEDENETVVKKDARPISVPSPVKGSGTVIETPSPVKSVSLGKSSSFPEASVPLMSPVKAEADQAQDSRSVVTASADEAEDNTSVKGASTDEAEGNTSVKGASTDEAEDNTSVKGASTDEAEGNTSVKGASADEAEGNTSVKGASADGAEGDTSIISQIDVVDQKPEPEQRQPSPQSEVQTSVAINDVVSEAQNGLGTIDGKLFSDLPALSKQKLQDLGIYDEEELEENHVNERDVNEIEEEEKPQALPEPTIKVESPSQESGDVLKYKSDQDGVSQIRDSDEVHDFGTKTETFDDPVQEIATSSEPISEFETLVFTNDGPDPTTTTHHSSVEQNIQYGIHNSSNGRDMGGIQEVDEEEIHEMVVDDDDDNNDDDEEEEENNDANGFEKDSNPDEEVKQNATCNDQEEEEELGRDSRTSAERQFEDVDDEASLQAGVDGVKDDKNSSPSHFEKDTCCDTVKCEKQDLESAESFDKSEDKDSLDGGTPDDDDKDIDELCSYEVNGHVDETADTNASSDHRFETDASVSPCLDVEARATDCCGQNKKQEFDNESDSESELAFDPSTQWGQPMGLPSPPPTEKKFLLDRTKSAASNGMDKQPGLARTSKSGAVADDGKSSRNAAPASGGKARAATAPPIAGRGAARPGSAGKRLSTGSSRSSPLNTKTPPLPPVTPYYVDLTYIPNHADSGYSDVEFFKRIRARYYVISSLSPNPQVLDSLLEAKGTWEQKALEVTIIPTYSNETLHHWFGLNAEKLQELRVDLKPAVSRCTIQLQDLETSLPAYRLEV